MEGRKGRNPSRAGLLTQKGVDEGFQWIKTVGVDFFFLPFYGMRQEAVGDDFFLKWHNIW